MSEQSVQEKLKAAFETLNTYDPEDVTIDDWGVRDEPLENAPWLVIHTADEFSARQDTRTPENRWTVPVTLIVPWEDWKLTTPLFRDYRQELIDLIQDQHRGAPGLDISEIRNLTGIVPYFDPHTEDRQVALPLFLEQAIAFEAREF